VAGYSALMQSSFLMRIPCFVSCVCSHGSWHFCAAVEISWPRKICLSLLKKIKQEKSSMVI
jgi:hypothetical protein